MKRALVCEDDLSIRTLVSTILRREQFTVDVTDNGQQAIEKIDAGRYDLFVVDLMMPGVDGYGVVRHIREKEPADLKRIVVMTAASEPIRGNFPEPVCTLLPKPFDLGMLTDIVRKCARECEERETADADRNAH